MTTIAQPEIPCRVTGGVDTHKDQHVAAALDQIGRLLGIAEFPATTAGYEQLHAWLAEHGEISAVGIEGCGSWGAGLARHLAAGDIEVVEVNRPNRQTRRRRGKSDSLDAEAAARAVLNGDAKATPKSGNGPVEALRQLRVARSGAVKARTAAANQLHSLLDTAPDGLRAQMAKLTFKQKVTLAEKFRPGTGNDVDASTRRRLTRTGSAAICRDDERAHDPIRLASDSWAGSSSGPMRAPHLFARLGFVDPASIYRSLVAAAASGDLDRVRELVSPESVWHGIGDGGVAELLTRLERFHEEHAHVRVELAALVVNGDQVGAHLRWSADSEGEAIRFDEIEMVRIRDGRVVEEWAVDDV